MPETSRGGPAFNPADYTIEKPSQQAQPQQTQGGFNPADYTVDAPQQESWWQKTEPVVRPAMEFGGMLAGGAAATPGTLGLGSVAGGALGYAGGKAGADYLYGKGEKTLTGQLAQTGKDLLEGAKMEAGGQALGAALPIVGKGIGKVARPWFAKLSGAGGARPLELAQEASTAFRQALRGNLTGEDIVENAHAALGSLKEQRAVNYLTDFKKIEAMQTDPFTGELKQLDAAPIQGRLRDLMKQYGVTVDPSGVLDTSRIAMGSKGAKDINEMIEKVWSWGTKPGDNTIRGLDTLKRQLDDFWSESSQARAFTTALRKQVSNTITYEVPAYGKMAKEYSEASSVIKDMEADLMLRKEGMSGRITADKTLRRLTSAMQDKFTLRRDLVQMLGAKGGEPDLERQIAGNAMSALAPKGAAGVIAGGEMAGLYVLGHALDPKYWAILLASSPRVQGEFLQVLGRGLKETKGMEIPVGKLITYLGNVRREAVDEKDLPGPFGPDGG